LSPDGSFIGETIAVLQLYTGEGFTFAEPTAALECKGFTILRWTSVPSERAFKEGLKKSCQLWIISDASTTLPSGHLSLVRQLVDDRKGLFVWADNDPFTVAANQVLAAIPETSSLKLKGNYIGDKVLCEASDTGSGSGFSKHLVTTGLEKLYEGITVASVKGMQAVHVPIIRASDGTVITAFTEQNGKRILMDGGFTRLMPDRWNRTAGTARFVTNAACWLFNFEGKSAGPSFDAIAGQTGGRSEFLDVNSIEAGAEKLTNVITECVLKEAGGERGHELVELYKSAYPKGYTA
jgi:hypothetical protein